MKILYLHQHFSTPHGAAGTRSYEFSKELIKRGHSVTILCGSYWIADTGLNHPFKNNLREGIVDGIHVKEIDLQYSNSDNFIKRSMTFFRFSWEGVIMALFSDYDICFASSTPLTAGIPGIFSRFIRRKPFVFEIRDLWPELPKAMKVIKNPIILKIMELLEILLYKSSTSCIGLSPGIVEGIQKKVPDKRVIMIPNGCDLSLNRIAKKNKDESKFKAAFTGAHGYANGLNDVLDVAQLLLKKNEKDIVFEFIGDGVLKPQLVERVRKEGLTNCVFLNPKPKKELFKYLQLEVDIGLMILENIPSFYYGTSPNKFFDYISLGLPVLNNYPGWLADLINQNNCGLVVPPKNPLKFAEAILTLKNDRKKVSVMRQNAMELSKSQFDRKYLSKSFVDYLESNM